MKLKLNLIRKLKYYRVIEVVSMEHRLPIFVHNTESYMKPPQQNDVAERKKSYFERNDEYNASKFWITSEHVGGSCVISKLPFK